VRTSKKQKVENCSPVMDDLFRRLFEVDPEKRITFAELKRHPIFAKNFIEMPLSIPKATRTIDDSDNCVEVMSEFRRKNDFPE
jgi:serine/threonine protein kinase